MTAAPPNITILALGSPHGDDGVGWHVAELLQAQGDFPIPCIRIGSPWDIVPYLQAGAACLVIDACRTGSPSGTLHEFSVNDMPADAPLASTHAGSLIGALRLAEALGCDLAKVRVLGIEASMCGPGAPLSEAARVAAQSLARRLRDELSGARLRG